MTTKLLSRIEVFKRLNYSELEFLEKTAGAMAYSMNEVIFHTKTILVLYMGSFRF